MTGKYVIKPKIEMGGFEHKVNNAEIELVNGRLKKN